MWYIGSDMIRWVALDMYAALLPFCPPFLYNLKPLIYYLTSILT